MTEQACLCGAIDFTQCACSVSDESCITIEGSGSAINPLVPEAIIDPDVESLLTEEPDGLLIQLPNFILNPPRVSAYHNAAISLTHNTGTVVSLNSEYYDTDGMHSTSTDNSRLTVVTPGVYIVTFVCAFAGNVDGDRQALIRKNGVDYLGGNEKKALSSASLECGMAVTIQEYFEEDEFIEAVVQQDSGVSLNLLAARYSPILSAQFRRRSPYD